MTGPSYSISSVRKVASEYWSTRKSGARMLANLDRCLTYLSEDADLRSVPCGTSVLRELRDSGLSAKSVQTYYAAFLRALELAGVHSVKRYPRAPTPERKIRPCLSVQDAQTVIDQLPDRCLTEAGLHAANVARLVLHAGLRPQEEAMREGAWRWRSQSVPGKYRVMEVTGKGDHTREVVVTDKLTQQIPGPVTSVSYRTICRTLTEVLPRVFPGRWTSSDSLPTLHSLRHLHARIVKDKTGDLETVQKQLGHASLTTTEIYLRTTHSTEDTIRRMTA